MAANPCFPTQVTRESLDKALSPERVGAIWRYAKAEYLDKGVDFAGTLKGVASDLGMPEQWVARAFTKPKALRVVTDQVYRAQSLRRDAIRQAKQMVHSIDAPGYQKIATRIWNIPRSILTAGHYAVFPVTHAGDLAFRPTAWNTYIKTVFQSWRFAGRAAHEAAMQELVQSPNYTIARRGGLINAPESDPVGILSNMSGASRRGFDALKITRQALFDKEWANIPPAERNIEMSKAISDWANKATGAVSGQVPLSKFQFAPQLTAAKWARAVVDPVRTLGTVAKIMTGEEVPFAERRVAAIRAKKAGEFAATYAGFLVVNQALNMALGSKDKVNFSDPSKSDWLQFKVAGHVLGVGAGVREIYGLLGGLVALGRQTPKERHGDSATVAIAKKVGRYALNKIDPTSSLILEGAVAREDKLTGRPLPWSPERGTAKMPKMGYGEYGATHLAPIPLTGATREAYESMRERGMSRLDIIALLKGAEAFFMESTGLRFYSDPNKKR